MKKINIKQLISKILLMSAISFLFIACNSPAGNTQIVVSPIPVQPEPEPVKDNIFYVPSLNHDYSAYQRTHTVYEYHSKDLGDSYYEVTKYVVHYFAASTGGNGATHHNNGAYRTMNEKQLVDIVKKRNTIPDLIQKHITTKAITKTITDYDSKQTVILYIPAKMKHEGHYYGITEK